MKTLKLFSKVSVIFVSILFCSAAHATDTRIFGLHLGERFNIPECKKKSLQEQIIYEDSTDKICFERDRTQESGPIINDGTRVDQVHLKFPADGRPQIMDGSKMYAMVFDGNLEGISFDTKGEAASELVMEKLKALYGAPSIMTPITFNRGKSIVNAYRADWNLKNLFVFFQNTNFSGEKGLVFIQTEKGKKRYAEQMKRVTIIV